MKAKEEIACHWLHGKKKEHECKTIFKWSYLAHSNKGRRPGLLHAAAGAAFGVQAATGRSYLAYPLLETAGASCPTSPHTSSSDTTVHATLSLVEYLVLSLGLYNQQFEEFQRGTGGSPPP